MVKSKKEYDVNCPSCKKKFIISEVTQKEFKEGIEIECPECNENVVIYNKDKVKLNKNKQTNNNLNQNKKHKDKISLKKENQIYFNSTCNFCKHMTTVTMPYKHIFDLYSNKNLQIKCPNCNELHIITYDSIKPIIDNLQKSEITKINKYIEKKET